MRAEAPETDHRTHRLDLGNEILNLYLFNFLISEYNHMI